MSILKESINFEIREIIRTNPKLSNRDIAKNLDGVSWQSVRANRSHVTMGTDTDNPQERKTPVKRNTYFGINKLSARNKKVKTIIATNKLVGDVLTLCGEGLIVENNLYSKGAKELSYDLVENNRTVFNKILMRVSKSPLDITSINNCSMNKMIHEAHTDKYAHGILDYCDTLNSNKSEIDMALNNNIFQVGGVVCMTFSIRGVKPIMSCETVENEAINLTAAKKYFSRFENYELVESFTYKDGAPMMVIILKRIL
jgi:hypothetical protein